MPSSVVIRVAGNIVGLSGFEDIDIGDTLTADENGHALPFTQIDPPTLGFDARNTLSIERAVGSAAPRLLISGWRDLGSNENTYRRQIDNVFHTTGALTWVRGSHTMKFGFQLRKNQFNVFNPGGNFMGIYNFNGEITSPTRNARQPAAKRPTPTAEPPTAAAASC